MKNRILLLMTFTVLLVLSVVAFAQVVVAPALPNILGMDPATVTIALGGLTSLLTAVFNKSEFTVNQKYLITYSVSFGVSLLGAVITHNITGDNLTWKGIVAGFFIVAGAANVVYALLRLKLNLLRDGFNGGDIVLPTNQKEAVKELQNQIEIAIKAYGVPFVFNKVMDVAGKHVTPLPITQAGIAGAVPAVGNAPLTGGTKLIVTPSLNLAGVVQDQAGYLHSSTGESFVNNNDEVPVVHIPTITQSPGKQAEIKAITDAVTNGIPIDDIVGENRATGGTE